MKGGAMKAKEKDSSEIDKRVRLVFSNRYQIMKSLFPTERVPKRKHFSVGMKKKKHCK